MLEILQNRYWALSPDFFEPIKSVVLHRLKNGQSLDIFRKEREDAEPMARSEKGTRVFRRNRRIAHVPLMGALTKRGDICELKD